MNIKLTICNLCARAAMLLLATVISLGARAEDLPDIPEIDNYQYYIPKAIIEIPDQILIGNSVNINYSVKAHIYSEEKDYGLVKDKDYTAEIKKGNITVTEPISDVGEYTLTITGIAPYFGSQEKQFKVIKFTSGDGSLNAPFAITNNIELDLLAGAVNSGQDFSKKYFKLTKDISYSYISNWDNTDSDENNYNSIGCFYETYIDYKDEYEGHDVTATIIHDYKFNGIFDGDGHTIKGIRVNITGDNGYVGLFGRLGSGAVVKNLTLDDANITGPQRTGGIAGINYGGKITNCHVTSNVTIHAVHATYNSWHGGIAGQNGSNDVNGEISYCTSAAKLTIKSGITSWDFYGGIVGQNMPGSTLDHNLVIGAIIPYAEGKHYGAIVGQNESSESLDHNYYADCTNDIGGCNGADVTEKDGAEIAIALYDSGTNATHNGMTITKYGNDRKTHNVILAGRTLYKDGAWNTLYLPFAFSASQIGSSSLSGATIKELDITRWYDSEGNHYEEAGDGRHRTGYDASDGTLYLNFMTSSEISSVTPYIIKWESGDNLVNPVFPDVTISTTSPSPSPILPSTDGYVSFDGTYDSTTYMSSDNTKLLIGGKSPVTGKTMLYYPKPDLSDPDNPKYPSIGAFRAYFQLNKGLTFGDPNATVRAFSLNFDDDPTGITTTSFTDNMDKTGAWYSLDGRKYNAKPTAKGLYIHHGKKIVIK